MACELLKGVRIADFSWVWAGPYCGTLLSFLGAEVIKVESHGRIDQTRQGTLMDGDNFDGYDYSPTFNNANLGKKGITINVKTPEGVELAKKLVSKCDVVLANMRPGKMAKLGLGYEDFRKEKEDIIMVESTGFGSSGPYSGFAGYAPIFASFGGLAYLTGYGDGAPNVMSGVQDLRVSVAAAFIIITALIQKKKTGKGTYIDVSSSECMSALVGPQLLAYTMNGMSPKRRGNADSIMAPHGVYPAKGEDRWISIAVGSDREWEELKEVMGNPEWTKNPEYDDMAGRWANRKAISQQMEKWTADYDAYDLMHLLQEHGIAAMPSMAAEDILTDEHTKARGLFTTMEHPTMGEFVTMQPAWHFSKTPAEIVKASPLLGEDNDSVFTDLLGLSAEEYEHLKVVKAVW